MIEFPLADGTAVPALGFGTYRLQGKSCTKACVHALEVGYRHFDTAQAYDNQEAIAPALKEVTRSELYLTSKLWIGDHTKERVPKACERILQELETDYLDLLLIHWPDRTVPFKETLGALAKLVQEGKIRSVGVSNFTVRHLQDILGIDVTVVANQIECHPYYYQDQLIEFCKEKGIRITAYAPLHKGAAAKDSTLQKIGAGYGKSASQVTLRWLIQKGIVAIPKSSHSERIEENFNIFDFEISQKEMGEIDKLNTGRRSVSPTFHDFDYT